MIFLQDCLNLPDSCKQKMESDQFWMEHVDFGSTLKNILTGACWGSGPLGNILKSMGVFDSRLILLESWFVFALQEVISWKPNKSS